MISTNIISTTYYSARCALNTCPYLRDRVF